MQEALASERANIEKPAEYVAQGCAAVRKEYLELLAEQAWQEYLNELQNRMKEDLEVAVPAARGPGRTWTPGPPPAAAAAEGAGMPIRIGYARCSTAGQELASQLDALGRADCRRVFSEKISTRVKVRPELAKALALAHEIKQAAPGQPVILTVHELRRLARNAAELMALSAQLQHLQQRTVQDRRPQLALDVVPEDEQLLPPELLLHVGRLRENGRDAIHISAVGVECSLRVVLAGVHASRRQQIHQHVGAALPQNGGYIDR